MPKLIPTRLLAYVICSTMLVPFGWCARAASPTEGHGVLETLPDWRATGLHVSLVEHKVILFVTNRAIDLTAADRARSRGIPLNPDDTFTSNRSEALTYGLATVTYPANRRKGDQAYPLNEVRLDPVRNFFVIDYELKGELGQLRSNIPAGDTGPALLFVHGYNNTFSDGVTRLAQLALDLGVPGTPVLFSWPGDHGLLGYSASEVDAAASLPFFAATVNQLGDLHLATYDVIAHSMGARIAVGVLGTRPLDPGPAPETSAVAYPMQPRGLIVAAGDMARSEFDRLLPHIDAGGMSVVVYCGHDAALGVSRILHMGEPRLGISCGTPMPTADVEFVQFTPYTLDTGHANFVSQVGMIDDMADVISHPEAHGRGGPRSIR